MCNSRRLRERRGQAEPVLCPQGSAAAAAPPWPAGGAGAHAPVLIWRLLAGPACPLARRTERRCRPCRRPPPQDARELRERLACEARMQRLPEGVQAVPLALRCAGRRAGLCFPSASYRVVPGAWQAHACVAATTSPGTPALHASPSPRRVACRDGGVCHVCNEEDEDEEDTIVQVQGDWGVARIGGDSTAVACACVVLSIAA
jgi:hypothetical protein